MNTLEASYLDRSGAFRVFTRSEAAYGERQVKSEPVNLM